MNIIIYYTCLLALLLYFVGIKTVVFAETTIPSVNFDAVKQILLAGQYHGISQYSSTSKSLDKGAATFFTEFSNGTYEIEGSTSKNGTINAICIIPRSKDNIYDIDVFIGGNFSSISNVTVNNIVRYNPQDRTFNPLLEGLDGTVYTLYCDRENSTVYVGGDFLAPVNPEAHNINVSAFGGSVAIWGGGTWSALPFKGFNGPVYTIKYNEKNNTIYFGGQFDATGDGNFGSLNSTQPINMKNATVNFNNKIYNILLSINEYIYTYLIIFIIVIFLLCFINILYHYIIHICIYYPIISYYYIFILFILMYLIISIRFRGEIRH